MKIISLFFSKTYSPVEYVILLTLTNFVLFKTTLTNICLALLILVLTVTLCVYIRVRFNLN